MPSAAHHAIDAAGVNITIVVTPPHISFTTSANGLALSVNCSASYGTSAPIVLSSWNFGDGGTAMGVTPTHTYASAGTYTVTYTATQSDGGTASTAQSITVNAPSAGGGGSGDPGTPSANRSTSGVVSYASLAQGSDLTGTVSNGNGSIVSMPAGTYSWSDFTHGLDGAPNDNGNNASGFQIASSLKGLYGAGSASTVLMMTANTSTKAGTVPAQSTGSTNQLYDIDAGNMQDGFVWDGLYMVGTAQGHLYNGLRLKNPGNITFSNSSFSGIPGSAGSPPGETFTVNVYAQAANKTITFTNDTFESKQNGGTSVAAALLGTNSTQGVITITDCLFQNSAYSAGVAIWELAAGGTVDLIRPVMKNCHRNVGNEAQAGTINIYDPLFDDPDSGEDDIRITWTSNYNSGTINVYFTAMANWNAFIANRTNKKILTICSVAQSYGGSAGGAYAGSNNITNFCHVFVGGVEQTLGNYWTFTGQTHN